MKNIITKISSVALAMMILLGVSSCVKDEFDEPPIPVVPVGDVMTVSDLWAMATAAPYKFTEDKSVYGVITMAEKNGNLYKEAFVQDVTGGMGLSMLSSTGLAIGDSVRIYLKGTRIKNYNDLLVLDSVDITDNVIRISAGNVTTPKEVTIADISTGAYVGQLVKVMDVQFKTGELGKTWADFSTLTTTNRDLEDCENATIVRTSGYANFAASLLPEGNGSLVAVASRYRGTDQLYVRDMAEVLLTGERCGSGGGGGLVDPVDAVNEGFDGAVDYSDFSAEGWTNVLVAGDRFWQGKTFNSDKYVQASGYNSGLAAMETWLITPPVTNISTKVLSVKTAMAYWTHNGNPFTVLISTDFVGDNFATATWSELDVTIATSSSSDNAWISSGEVDLSAYSGNAAIAFRYVGSDAESTSFRIDDVLIDLPGSGGGGGGGGTVDPVDEVNEQFNSAVNYSDIDFDGWTNVKVQGDRAWQGKEFDVEKYAQASGYNSGLDAMETWLITPPVTNIGSKILSLKTAMAYWAHGANSPLTVLVSEDFVGDNFETATWTEISVPMANEASGDNTWVESGDIALSAFSGNAAIAFKYVGSGTETTSFRIDDILINTDGSGGGGGGGGGGGFDPVDQIDEQFNSAVNYEDFAATGWTNMNVVGDRKWQGKEYNADKYIQASGYNSGLAEMESWIITPPITNIGTKSLSLKTAKAYWAHSGNPLTVLVSEDFNGENFETATWTELTVTLASEADDDHAWIDSGLVSLSAFSGNAAIAFKYVGSDTESTSFRIDDILVQ